MRCAELLRGQSCDLPDHLPGCRWGSLDLGLATFQITFPMNSPCSLRHLTFSVSVQRQTDSPDNQIEGSLSTVASSRGEKGIQESVDVSEEWKVGAEKEQAED